MESSTRVGPFAKTTAFSRTSARLKPSMLSPTFMRRGPCDAAWTPAGGRAAPSPSCTIAYRFEPRIAVPSRTMLRIRCAARVSASVSLVLPAPLSGSNRFLETMTSVPTIGDAASVRALSSPRSTTGFCLTGPGKFHGPLCHSQYIFSPTPARDAANSSASTRTRV